MEYIALEINKSPPQAPPWISVENKFCMVTSKFRLVLFIVKRERQGCSEAEAKSQLHSHQQFWLLNWVVQSWIFFFFIVSELQKNYEKV